MVELINPSFLMNSDGLLLADFSIDILLLIGKLVILSDDVNRLGSSETKDDILLFFVIERRIIAGSSASLLGSDANFLLFNILS